ncbi:macrolide family glycosyltransferase [Paenibacillus graminis]|uniref:macrolide family glycosyltransferase n=1 Tax=Paenibacillus graminis TaxID=189425 RepID=UPI000470C95B|nr:macrolide family glycosyltransferase [Paenibacillus graminis]
MSKVIFLSYPFFSHVIPSLALVRELLDRGEEVIYYSVEAYKDAVEESGAVFRDYGDIIRLLEAATDQINYAGYPTPVDILYSLVPSKILKSKKVVQRIVNRVLADNPDYIVRDCEAYWGRLLGNILDVPVVCYITTIALNNRMMDINKEGFMESVFSMSADSLPVAEKESVSQVLDHITAGIAKEQGVEGYTVLDALAGGDEFNIVYTSREFQPYAETFGDNYVFIGPSVRASKEKTDFPFQKEADRPVLLIAFGNIFNNTLELYKRCMEAFRDTGFSVIMSVGKKVDISLLGDVPANFVVVNQVPQVELMPQVDVFLSHGGYNSLSEAIDNHVPLVLFPQGADQVATSSRIEETGAGVYVRNREISPVELLEIVEGVYQNSEYRHNCRQLADSFRLSGGAKLGADAILAFISEAIVV